jgi:imidazolonepropionase-like amidohydrolase
VHAGDVRALGQALVFGSPPSWTWDYLKVSLEDQAWSGSPGMSAATVGALVAAAHARGMLSMAHADSAATARIFNQAGRDALAHVLGDLEVTPEFLADPRGPAFVIATLRAAAVLVRGTGRPAGGRPG